MATLDCDPSGECWGVLYEIATTDYEHLELTEGVRIDHYRRAQIEVAPIHSWDAPLVSAVTLVSGVHDPALKPTTRYMSILVAGATGHGLPAAWIEVLRNIEAVEERDELAALRPWIDDAMRRRE